MTRFFFFFKKKDNPQTTECQCFPQTNIMVTPSSSEWWRKVDFQQRHKVKRQTPGFGPSSATDLPVLEETSVLTSPLPRASVSPTKTRGEEEAGKCVQTHQDLVERHVRKQHLIDELTRVVREPKQKPRWHPGVGERAGPAVHRASARSGSGAPAGGRQKAISRDNSWCLSLARDAARAVVSVSCFSLRSSPRRIGSARRSPGTGSIPSLPAPEEGGAGGRRHSAKATPRGSAPIADVCSTGKVHSPNKPLQGAIRERLIQSKDPLHAGDHLPAQLSLRSRVSKIPQCKHRHSLSPSRLFTPRGSFHIIALARAASPPRSLKASG